MLCASVLTVLAVSYWHVFSTMMGGNLCVTEKGNEILKSVPGQRRQLREVCQMSISFHRVEKCLKQLLENMKPRDER